MNLNHLLHHHQLSLMQADAVPAGTAREGYRRAAFAYARRIADLQPFRAGATPLVPLS